MNPLTAEIGSSVPQLPNSSPSPLASGAQGVGGFTGKHHQGRVAENVDGIGGGPHGVVEHRLSEGFPLEQVLPGYFGGGPQGPAAGFLDRKSVV